MGSAPRWAPTSTGHLAGTCALAWLLVLGDGAGCAAEHDPPSRAARVVGLTVNQATEVRLADEAGAVQLEPIVGMVRGRRARVSVEARRLPGEEAGPELLLELWLTWRGPAGGTETAGPVPLTIPSDAGQGSAELWLEGPAVLPGAGLRAELRDAPGAPAAQLEGLDGAPAVWPPEGEPPLSLPVFEEDLVLDVRVVPFEIVLNGCEPPVSRPDDLSPLRDALLAQLPVRDVTLSLDDPVAWPGQVQTVEQQLALVDAVKQRRLADSAPFRVYAGLYTQCASCSSNCAGGLAFRGDGTPQTQVLLASLWRGDRDALAQTLVHEMGHVLGRGHVSCPGQEFMDEPDYPVPDGRLDAPGLDILSGEPHVPSSTFDFMSYCAPTWASGYTWSRVLDFARDHLAAESEQAAAPTSRATVPHPEPSPLVCFPSNEGG